MKGFAQNARPANLLAEDVAQVLAFLVSEENNHITGQVVFVDGGAEVTLP